MIKITFSGVLLLILIACNDNKQNTETSGTDTTTHTDHQPETNTSADTTGMTGKSMMTMMNSIMDNMKSMQSTGNPDNDFAAMMKAHHLGAIEMAQMQVAKGTDPQIKQMAQKMINDQQREVAELNAFLSGHSAHGGGEAFFKEAMGIMNNMKMDMNHSGTIDIQFVQMMIPHHQSAIDMSRAYIKGGAHEEKMKEMANKIIADQQKEINELKAWLDKNE